MRSGCGAILLWAMMGVVGVAAIIGCQHDTRPDEQKAAPPMPTTITHDHIPPPRTPEN